MRAFATILALTLVTSVSAADLDSFGLEGVEQITEQEASTVRGQGALAWGNSHVSVVIPRYNFAAIANNGYRSFGNRKAGGENGSQLSVDLRGRRGYRVNLPASGGGNGAGFCPPGWGNGVGNPHNCLPSTGSVRIKMPRIKIEAFAGGFSSAYSK
jgi:hypothetical protein